MIDPLLERDEGQTPLETNELAGLKLSWVRTRRDLNEAEQANIVSALRAARTPRLEQVLDDLWLRRLHRRMFGDVWSWAGTYRTREMNLGIDPVLIPVEVRTLVADARVWCETEEPALAAARFHHRLVWIHPFPNGNGRHGRAAADSLLRALGQAPFTWGSLRDSAAEARASYLHALRLADRGDLDALVAFACS